MERASSFWITAPGTAEIRTQALPDLGGGEALVETLFGAISRGTERLVFAGQVPPAEFERMRAPFQEGEFDFPVKYGYAAVGRVARGPEDLVGRDVFCLHPHQSRFVADAAMLLPLPGDVPPERAVLAANMETALNVVWDGGVAPGDRVAVVGAGLLGLLVAWLASRVPGTETTLVDVDPSRGGIAAALGIAFAAPAEAPRDCDVVVHASASANGLATAIEAAGTEARVVEMSWYGTKPVEVALGGAFHSRRLSLVSSQVGAVPAARRARWSLRRRMETTLQLLQDPALDHLVSGETPFGDLPARYGAILADPSTLCHRISYQR